MTTERIIIRLGDPLPCAVLTGELRPCGRPANVAYAWRMSAPAEMPTWAHLSGCWTVQPVCADCARAAADVYGVE